MNIRTLEDVQEDYQRRGKLLDAYTMANSSKDWDDTRKNIAILYLNYPPIIQPEPSIERNLTMQQAQIMIPTFRPRPGFDNKQ